MNCNHIQELIGLYRDLPDNDFRRAAVEEHIRRCATCAEEFKLWEESYRLISQASMDPEEPEIPSRSIAASVMNRIYMDESWRLPVAERAYSLTKAMKYRISAVIGFCLALFISSFIYSLLTEDDKSQEAYAFRPGIVPVISATGDTPTQLAAFSQEIPMASISAPFVLDIGPVDSYPDYLIVVSIIGIVCSLLIMNWLSRLRA